MAPPATPTATAEREGLIIRIPTPTPIRTPDATPRPEPTPAPTLWEMSATDDICYRSPAVQKALMIALNLRQCRIIGIGELFRLDEELNLEGPLHPQDLEGLVNLQRLTLVETDLQHQDLKDVPNLRRLLMNRPVNYRHLELGHLKHLERLHIDPANAECTLLKRGFIKQLLDGLENLKEVEFKVRVYMPSTSENQQIVERRVQTEVLIAADSPLERDDIRVEVSLYNPETNQNALPPCSDGH